MGKIGSWEIGEEMEVTWEDGEFNKSLQHKTSFVLNYLMKYSTLENPVRSSFLKALLGKPPCVSCTSLRAFDEFTLCRTCLSRLGIYV